MAMQNGRHLGRIASSARILDGLVESRQPLTGTVTSLVLSYRKQYKAVNLDQNPISETLTIAQGISCSTKLAPCQLNSHRSG